MSHGVIGHGVMGHGSEPDTVTLCERTMGMELEIKDVNSLAVLGIALVVDQLGKGARMIFRYPVAPAAHRDFVTNDDLFFRLPSRQMAKLFRPKPSLCGQPMTVRIGHTVFCCCATLMGAGAGGTASASDADHESNLPGSAVSTEGSDDRQSNLVTFSVIIALATISDDFSRRQIPSYSKRTQSVKNRRNQNSDALLCIHRVHLSLSRLCRVLAREERRCRYVSLQAHHFEKIRSEWHKIYLSNSKSITNSTSINLVSPISSSAGGGSERKRSHHRVQSTGRGDLQTLIDNSAGKSIKAADDHNNAVDIEQEALEVILTANGPFEKDDSSIETVQYFCRSHKGNLAQELAQVYHALDRNEQDLPPCAADLLTSKNSTVYINRHIAVSINALSKSLGVSHADFSSLRPYHTLLYSHVSPWQLMESLTMSGSVAPQQLLQFLAVSSPQKSLKDISSEAGLSLQKSIEIGSYLFSQGVCLVSPILSQETRLICSSVHRIRESALEFSQTFGMAVNIFHLVSFLTQSGRSLGESMTILSATSDESVSFLRECLEKSIWSQADSGSLHPASVYLNPIDHNIVSDDVLCSIALLEDLLYRMATWLRSRKVINHLIEFLVASRPFPPQTIVRSDSPSDEEVNKELCTSRSEGKKEIKSQKGIDEGKIMDNALYHELLDLGCLDGRSSIQFCSWKLGLGSTSRLRTFASCHDQVRIVLREPIDGDDW